MSDWLPSVWPAFFIGLILAVYWLRVLQMVRRTPKSAGHHANFIPEEKLGRALRIIWMPVVALWVVLPLLHSYGIGSGIAPLRPLADWPIVQWSALAVALGAFALTWLCWGRMGKSWRMGIDPNERTQLVFTGPFAYVRHPIYGLSSLLMLCTMLILPSPMMLFVGLLHLLLLQWEVQREEVYLCSVHGPAYQAYQQHVGRFFPRSLRAYRPQ
jgi:protein-S-isoprenylcysteine O-methyltransferase Ste14